MVRRIAISICLFIFASSSSFVAAEPSTKFQEDSQTSFYSDDEDSSADPTALVVLSKDPQGVNLHLRACPA